MKKLFRLFFAFVLSFTLVFGLASCKEEEQSSQFNPIDVSTTTIDHYYGNQISFADTNTTLGTRFIRDKVAILKLKTVTDGDTAVFYLNEETDGYTNSLGKEYDYITVRFLAIDTPESTSAIDPWGKAASNYVRETLKNAKSIIVDASDVDADGTSNEAIKSRLDSNGTRWLGLIWYSNDEDATDLTKYRLLQLDVIEECYSRYTGSDETTRYVYAANQSKEPKLYSRYEEQFGALKIGDVLLEADIRMSQAKLRRLGDQVDPNYDYSKTPTPLTIEQCLDEFDTYAPKGTFVSITGVIVKFIGPNFYMADEKGNGLYVYMGIDGNSIEGDGSSQFKVGDTINIRGRLAEYGGQKQLSGIVFKKETFIKITDESKKIALPTVITLTGKETLAEYEALVGKLVTTTLTVASVGSLSKDKSYTLYSNTKISELNGLTTYDSLSVRINGTLAPGYDRDDQIKGGTAVVTGIMSVYKEDDYTLSKTYPSYQIVVGNKQYVNGEHVSEIVYKK